MNSRGNRDMSNLQPPDGGWAWVIVFASSTIVALMAMPVSVYGILYSGILMNTDVSTATVTWIFNLQLAISNIVPLFSAPLTKIYGYRKLAFCGCFLCGLAIILSGLATRPLHLFLTYSLLAGVGFGLALPNCNYITAQYFKKYLGRANGLLMSFRNLSFLLTPILVERLQFGYGYKGATFIVGAIMLNGCVSASLFHPIEWHAVAKLEEEGTDEGKENDASDDDEDENQTDKTTFRDCLLEKVKIEKNGRLDEGSAGNINKSLRRQSHPCNSDINETLLTNQKLSASSILSVKEHNGAVHSKRQNESNHFHSSSLIACSVNSIDSIMIIPLSNFPLGSSETKNIDNDKDKSDLSTERRTKIIPQLFNILKSIGQNLSMYRSHRIKILIISIPVLALSTMNSIMLIPFLVVENGHSLEDASWVISMYAIGGIISRIGVSILADKLRFEKKVYFMCGSLWAFLSILALGLLSDLTWFAAATFSLGFGFGAAIAPFTVLVIEIMGLEILPQTYSLISLAASFHKILSGPLIGLIRDQSGSYSFTIMMLSILAFASFLAFFLMPWAQKSDKERGIAQLNTNENKN